MKLQNQEVQFSLSMFENYRINQLQDQVESLQTVLLIFAVLLVLFFARNLYNLIRKRSYRKKNTQLIIEQTEANNRLLDQEHVIEYLENDYQAEKQQHEIKVSEYIKEVTTIRETTIELEERLKEQKQLSEYQRKALEKFANYKTIDANNTRLGAHFIKNVISHVYQNLEVAQDKSASILNFSLSSKGSDDVKISIGALKNMFALLDYNVAAVHAVHKEKVTIEEEVSHLEKFIDLLRFLKPKSTITLIKKLDDTNITHLKIKPTLFFPFIENALKHGSLNETDSFITITVSCNNGNQLSYEVENSCETTTEQISNVESKSPFGLNALKKLMETYYPSSTVTHQIVGTNRYVAQLKLTV